MEDYLPCLLVFLSLQAFKGQYFNVRDVAQFGSARRSGRRGRWFESSHPDLKRCKLTTYGVFLL